MRPCLLIPIYDHGAAIPWVVASLAGFGARCFIVDDGSRAETRLVLDELEERHPWIEVHHRKRNGGRGAALKTGYRLALSRGFTHAVQLDADGQHDAADVPRFFEEIERQPGALVLGAPIFDASAPRSRIWGRQLSRAMVWLSTLSFDVADPLCGFRGIPLAPSVELIDATPTGDHMDFDPELVILHHWLGTPIRNLPTRVVYDPEGLSHFEMLGDNARMTGLYARSLGGMLRRAPQLLSRKAGGARA